MPLATSKIIAKLLFWIPKGHFHLDDMKLVEPLNRLWITLLQLGADMRLPGANEVL